MEQVVKILDKSLDAGGAWLSRKQMGLGNNKKDTNLLETLCKKGYLGSPAKNKFSVGEKGLAFWRRKIGEYRYRVVCDNVIERFLRVVEQRDGKKLTKTQIYAFPVFWIEKALKQKYCESVGDAKFRLLPAGEDFLFSRLSASEQAGIKRAKFLDKLEKMKSQQRDLQQSLTCLQNEVVKEFSELQLQEAQAQELGQHLDQKIEEGERAYLESVRELQNCQKFVEATRIFRQQVAEEREKAISEVEKRCREIGKRLGEIEIKTVGELQRIEQKLGDFHKDLCESRDSAKIPEKELREIPLPTNLHDDFADKLKLEECPEEEIFQIVNEIYRRHVRANPHLAGSMPIPELFDELKSKRAVVELKVLHDLLLQWMREERITLWVCSTPGLEPRAGEGIESERGLLFYLRI